MELKITLYNNRVKEASYRKISEQEYEVTLLVESEKTYYDGNGRELEKGARLNFIEIGIFDEDVKNDRGMTEKAPIYLQKHWISPGASTLTYKVDKVPVKVGIDPYNKLIDRIPDDNLKALTLKE